MLRMGQCEQERADGRAMHEHGPLKEVSIQSS